LKGTIAGLLIGAGLLVVGALEYLNGLGQPQIPVSCWLEAGCAWGNLTYWIGIILMIAGLATLTGAIGVGLGILGRRSEAPPSD
jgi:hypothetical protein